MSEYIPIIASGVAGILSLIAVTISLYVQYYTSRKTTFINTVTSERVRWMGELRDNTSRLCSIAFSLVDNPYSTNREDLAKELNRVAVQIKLLLNPDEHLNIIKSLESIINSTSFQNLSDNMLNNFVASIQEMLKDEWEKIKKEAREGELPKKSIINPWMPHRLRRQVYSEEFTKKTE